MNPIKLLSKLMLITIFFDKRVSAASNKMSIQPYLEEESNSQTYVPHDQNFLNCTFYSSTLKRYKTNLIKKNIFKNFPDIMQAKMLNFCVKHGEYKSGWLTTIQSITGVIFISAVVAYSFKHHLAKFYSHSAASSIINISTIQQRILVLVTRSTLGEKTYSSQPALIAEAMSSHLTEIVSIETTAYDQELKRRFINKINNNECLTVDDFVCDYGNKENIVNLSRNRQYQLTMS